MFERIWGDKMKEYGVTCTYEEDGEPIVDSMMVEANSTEEAAGYVHNLMVNERGINLMGDIEVYPPGEDIPEIFPV